MAFNFNVTQTVSDLNSVSSCLGAWSRRVPTFRCTKDETAEHLTLTILRNGSTWVLKVKEATAKHEYKKVHESTAMGPPEISKRYNLEVNGKVVNGENFKFGAYFFTESENGGRTWSDPSRSISLQSRL